MPRSNLWPLLLIVILSVPALRAQEKEGNGAAGGEMEAFHDRNLGVHVNHPKDWQQRQSTNASLALVFVSTKTPPGQHFNDNFNLVITRAGGETDLEKMIDAAKVQLKRQYPALRVLSDSKVTISGQSARKLVYSNTIQDLQMQVTQAFTIANDNVYILTFTTLAERGEVLAPVITAMMDSFRVDKIVKGKENAGPGEMADFQDAEHHFRFKYPANWEKRPPTNSSVIAALADPKPHAGFAENVNIGYRELPADVDIDAIVTATTDALAKQFTDFKLVENSKVDIDGRAGRKVIYTGTRGIPMKLTQVFVIDHRRFYTFAVGTAPQRYEEMKPTIEQMVSSIRLDK